MMMMIMVAIMIVIVMMMVCMIMVMVMFWQQARKGPERQCNNHHAGNQQQIGLYF